MSNRKEQLVNNEIYHIILRGVGDLPIFKNKNDYYRCVFSLYSFNDNRPIEIRKERRLKRKVSGRPTSAKTKKRDKFVEILAFCLMPNHIHLLLKQVKNDGISKFMKKFATGYAKYFNESYKRMGHLFQGRFRSIHIKNDAQLKVIFNYIHTNPVSLIDPKWKSEGIKNSKKAVEFIENYKWSSYGDYIGTKNFPSLTDRGFIIEIIGGTTSCQEVVNDWINNRKLITKQD